MRGKTQSKSRTGKQKGTRMDNSKTSLLQMKKMLNIRDVCKDCSIERKKKSVVYRKVSFPGGSVVKNLPVIQKTGVRSLHWEDPLEKEMATHSTILAWRIPWTEEPGGLQSTGSQSQTRLNE